MMTDFPGQVSLAQERGDADLARDVYERAEQLPSYVTDQHFRVEGYQLNGPLFPGSTLVTAYRGLSVFIVKMHKNGELERVKNFREVAKPSALTQEDMLVVHSHVIPFKLWVDPVRPDRGFMVMPKLCSTLEPIMQLSEEHTYLLWDHLSSALRCLHNLGFVHGDVKPANIGLQAAWGLSPSFVLIDLGSIQRFGMRVLATPPYIPSDFKHKDDRLLATTSVDWWMFTVTLAEKGCRSPMRVGEGAWGGSAPPQTVVLSHLERDGNLSVVVLQQLRAELNSCGATAGLQTAASDIR